MAFIELQSEDHRHLLDIFDRLRSGGICKHVHLPEIIVCGGRSAGKSSVLEAISGISFLTEDNACTRFTTELVLRRQDTTAVKISINPGLEQSGHERRRSGSFTVPVSFEKPDIETIIGEAKEAMGLSETKMFSTDILRVELCGPTQPHLTVVDLPGIFRADGQDQKAQDAETIRTLVRNYVKRPHSIILAVISAENYSCLGDITDMVREHDPRGVRTLGLITKPDVLETGSDKEAAYVQLAKNMEVLSQLGWHVLKNRDHKARDGPSVDRNEDEERFFSRGIWATIDPRYLGIKSLMPRLRNMLRNQILQQVPSIIHEVDKEIDTCRAQLARLGKPRTTGLEQRKYILQVSREFTTLIKAAVDGQYNDAFFGSAKSDEGYRKRLRARVQNTLTNFEKEMREKGQNRVIVDDSGSQERKLPDDHQWRSIFVDEVVNIMGRSRTRGLPGTFNSQIIRELFIEQCQPWRTISTKVKEEILGIVDDVVQAIVDHVAFGDTTRGIYYLINNEIKKLKGELSTKFREILRQYVDGHPITYNSYLIDMVQKEQERRTHDQLEETFKKVVGRESFQEGHEINISPLGLCNSLKEYMNVDMERSGAEMAIDYMLAYYKLALEKFVDDISVLAVEQCLLEKLPALFPSEAVMDLQDKDMTYFVKERETAPTERTRCADKLKILETQRRGLTRLDTRRAPQMTDAVGESLPGPRIPRSYTTDSVTADEARAMFSKSPSLAKAHNSPKFVVYAEVAAPPTAVHEDECKCTLGHDAPPCPIEDEARAPETEPQVMTETEPLAEWHELPAEKAPEAAPTPEAVSDEPEPEPQPEPETPAEEEYGPEPETNEQDQDSWGFKPKKKETWYGTWGHAPVDSEPVVAEAEAEPAVAPEPEEAKPGLEPKHGACFSARARKLRKCNKARAFLREAAHLPGPAREVESEVVPGQRLADPWNWAR